MNYGFRFLSLGVLVCAPIAGCVGEEPKVDNQQNTEGGCLTLQGRWALKGSGCSLDTTCTITQTGCTASFTCEDGTHSSSSVTVYGSNWNFTGASTAQPGATISCSGTKSGGTLSASCSVPGGTTCSVSGSFLGAVTGGNTGGNGNGSGGAGNSGGGPNGGTGNAGGLGNGGSGATGSGGGPLTQCSLTANSPGCQDCFSANCGTVCSACQGDAQCNTAIECIVTCTTGSCDCTSGLTNANSQTLFSNLASCLTDTCSSVCGGTTDTGAIGDACSVDADCTTANPTATCNAGHWCTFGCTYDSDCGAASNGVLNHCILNSSNSYTCFPGCTVDLDCAGLTGTTCQLVPGTASTYVCATAPGSSGAGGSGG